jgi:hypothetical protein
MDLDSLDFTLEAKSKSNLEPTKARLLELTHMALIKTKSNLGWLRGLLRPTLRVGPKDIGWDNPSRLKANLFLVALKF